MKYIITLCFTLIFTQIIAQDSFNPDEALLCKLSRTESKVFFSEHSKVPAVPASLLKLVTTSTALEVLGPNFRYRTRVGYTGDIINGVLHGNIIIVSGNDPTLGSDLFDSTSVDILFSQIKHSLELKQIQHIKGDIQIQFNSATVDYPAARLWEDMGNYYGGIPNNLNFRDNTIRITLQSTEVGSKVKVVDIAPDIDYYTIQSNAIAAAHQKDSAYVYGISQLQKWWIEGSIPANLEAFTIKSAMPDPSMVFVQDLRLFLKENQIEFSNNTEESTSTDGAFQLLCEVYSPTLSEIIKVTNHKSNNLFADQLFLTLAERYSGVQSWDNGVLAIESFWKDKIDYVSNFNIKDGSGLSPKNHLTSEGIVQLLEWMQNNSSHFDVFKESLAIGGQSGTLEYVFRDSKIKGKILGKSGSMESVVAYAGYYIKNDNNYIPFCIIANNFLSSSKSARKYIDKYLTAQFSK
ncbi:D-alanyl-D-alanine carboxypeptidase/D-alanyl-D-alanine endopeptidase [Saccharicrinis aurantiacus]|uniref:D-alanyl-D-alanine carboxypeptidase/D-alanyl-D-alanine endopeptidase n=1 Tax=Saccharicrinis aurantiacus TaxID=1849719 RepID=UPI00094F7EDE|nr:D-alanyl-D-alanine carboxypeptidase/D-alanyl-D-alanine-endopeptidase [Saccharicrinis aurantiacus]